LIRRRQRKIPREKLIATLNFFPCLHLNNRSFWLCRGVHIPANLDRKSLPHGRKRNHFVETGFYLRKNPQVVPYLGEAVQ
jgi:hypothetical protein